MISVVTCPLRITLMLSKWMYDLCGNLFLDRVNSELLLVNDIFDYPLRNVLMSHCSHTPHKPLNAGATIINAGAIVC